jgi:oligopeptidase B
VRTIRILALLLLLVPFGAPAGETPGVKPPAARKVPKVTEIHGEKLVDDYAWLREKENPAVRAYLDAENAYADAVTKPGEALRKRLYEEAVGRIVETDRSVPYRHRGWLWYSRTQKGQQYPISCRKKGSLEAPEEVVLDLNEIAKTEAFVGRGVYVPSDDANLLAYSIDTTGFRLYTLQVKDLKSGRLLADRVEKVTSVAWAADGRTLFYVVEDAAKRPYRLYRHAVGTAGPGTLVYEERDERFTLEVSRSRDDRWVLVASESHTQKEWRLIPAAKPAEAPQLVLAREKDHEYDVEAAGDLLYIRTNDGCRDFRVVRAPAASPGKESWKELVPCRDGVLVAGVEAFATHLVLAELEDALPRLSVLDLASGRTHRIEATEAIASVLPETNPEYGAKSYRFSQQSFTTAPMVFDHDVATRERTLLKKTEVPGGYDPSRYRSERLFATAPDGTKVPVSVVSLRDVPRDGTAPLLLKGYGSYGFPSTVAFDPALPSLLDRGVVFALAHVRGGGDLGKKWHDAGRMTSKKNTFTDFVACAEALAAAKLASKDRIAIQGGSAGGLLVGAVVNLRPELFRAALLHVPFVDVVNTMLDETLPLTVGEFEEWGNPKKKAEYLYMRSYSPYENLRKGAYPSILAKTSFNDSQVMYWEPAKYVAKLRTLKTDENPLLLVTNMAGGHGGSSGRYDRLRETAFDQAFVLGQLGVPDLPAAVPAPSPARPVSTYSIVARDPATGQLGVAVQSHWFSVGALVPWAEAGVGAVATQSFVDPSYGPLGLALLRAGRNASEALRGLLAADEGREVRQVAMIDAAGRVAAHTGARCIEAAGHAAGKDYSVQANMMRGATVWPAMAKAFEAAKGDLAERMLAALEAAEAAGGDIRGKQSAALVVVSGSPTGRPWQDRVFDLRVEDSPAPLPELRRLVTLARAYNLMNEGDLAVEKKDDAGALAAYSAARAIAPGNAEMVYWTAVSLVGMGRVEEALPLFRETFAIDASWAELTRRLPKAGLLPDDAALIGRIVAQAPKAR